MKIRLALVLVLISAMVVFGDQAAKAPFALEISTDQPVVKAGSAVWIKVHLTNTSKRTMDCSATISNMTGVDPNYIFEVRDEAANAAPIRMHEHPELATGQPISRSLKPGESLTDDEEVSQVIDMSRPGQYTIQVSRRVSDSKKDGVVKSNAITISVTPQP
jgi:hypothetical protein